MAELETALNAKFGEEFPGRGAFAYSYAASSSLGILDQTAAKIIKGLARGGHVVPYDFWGIGLRFFEWINQSDFRQLLTLSLAEWQRAGWKRIISEESFRLSRPLQTVPAIETALSEPENDQRFLAQLILATADAVGSPLGADYSDILRAMAKEAGQ
jgi:hypothetical protein